ncbi:hypothetical protein [Staphylococcus sp. 11-B-312]|uniref:hypothetical protein n=1 Tax=Staphylococcus sp. 11-B-312 TaxID=2799680 RepID=UPI001939E7AA|nr:hypothetical protein [Staphylococcus sp. 11-B-312]QQV52225.1 hypothetical protein JG554_09025 [Staphylococcus sp. 11-B-312]
MSKDVDVIQFRNSDGEYVYTKTHLDAIDGMEEYTEGLTQVAQILGDFIFDTGWKEYDTHIDVKKNSLYSSDGFNCGIREVILNPSIFGNGNQIRLKMIRVNLRDFVDGQQIAQLPTGFMSNTQVFYSRSGSGKQPIMVEIRSNGKLNVYIDKADQSAKSIDNWIYAQFTWIE